VKIAVCGLVKSENLGEMFIARSLEYLITDGLEQAEPGIGIEYVEVDLLGRNETVVDLDDPREWLVRNFYRYSDRGHFTERVFQYLQRKGRSARSKAAQNAISRVRHLIWRFGRNYRRRLNSYFDMKLEGVDFIVIDGAGLLEYSFNEYHWPLSLISEYAERHGLEVVYNAIGRAGAFDERDFGSTILKRAIQSPAVKYVSARDNVEAVQACAGPKRRVKLLADSAFWMKEAYGIDTTVARTKIGIGLIRGNSLEGYGVSFGSKQWVSLFAGIARALEERGYEFEFFTNGLPGDVKLGQRVLRRMKLDDSYLVERPVDDTVLVDTINGYRAIITCRMHSSIAAFTMGVPSVILSWNDKVEKLMEIIGYPERAIKRTQFTPEFIVDAMELALAAGVEPERLAGMKSKAKESVGDYLGLILSARHR